MRCSRFSWRGPACAERGQRSTPSGPWGSSGTRDESAPCGERLWTAYLTRDCAVGPLATASLYGLSGRGL
eukprot:5892114-Prymnesium_polylepis.1